MNPFASTSFMSEEDDRTEMVSFAFEDRTDTAFAKTNIKAFLYASPRMIEQAEAWRGGILDDPRQIYDKLIELGAMRDGRNAWVAEHLKDVGDRYPEYESQGVTRETWIDNQLDSRETISKDGQGVREFFKGGQPDPNRPAEPFRPLDGFGGLSAITITPRPDEPQQGLVDLPKFQGALTNPFVSSVTEDDTCTEMVSFDFKKRIKSDENAESHTMAFLYASPRMIEQTEVWRATQPKATPGQVYQNLIVQGAVRDGRDCWHTEIVADLNGGYRSHFTLQKTISETWIDNQLDMRETIVKGEQAVREFFKNGQPDLDRPVRHFWPLSGLGGLSQITVTHRPDAPQPKLFNIPKL